MLLVRCCCSSWLMKFPNVRTGRSDSPFGTCKAVSCRLHTSATSQDWLLLIFPRYIVGNAVENNANVVGKNGLSTSLFSKTKSTTKKGWSVALAWDCPFLLPNPNGTPLITSLLAWLDYIL
jgi:hypothetical protein